MRAKLAGLTLVLGLSAGMCAAQDEPRTAGPQGSADYSSVYCSGFVGERISDETRVISGEHSDYKVVFEQGDYVYINRGAEKGIKVGDRFSVARMEPELRGREWFHEQKKLTRAMGTTYSDIGTVRVVNVQPNVAIAQVEFSCEYVQRGDILRAFVERPIPALKDPTTFDHFAPVNGKKMATIVSTRGTPQMLGKNNTVYVNLGNSQNVKVGDYFRIFRYQGSRGNAVPETKGSQYMVYGFGGSPTRYEGKDLPREIVGEGVVLNASANSSTVLITRSSSEIFTGDYVELE